MEQKYLGVDTWSCFLWPATWQPTSPYENRNSQTFAAASPFLSALACATEMHNVALSQWSLIHSWLLLGRFLRWAWEALRLRQGQRDKSARDNKKPAGRNGCVKLRNNLNSGEDRPHQQVAIPAILILSQQKTSQ